VNSTTPANAGAARQIVPFHAKWWSYQRERFPLIAHGLLIAAFSFCAVSISAMLRGSSGVPGGRSILVAFATCFCFFLQLRIADEFKDLEEDARYRPYRPVPRGLVTLRELGWLFVIVAAIQLGLALWLDRRLLVLLGVTWTYLALMSKEFFVADWLRPRAVLYMLSHMLIMPLVDLYATSTDWLPRQGHPPHGLIWFLLASYCNGLVIEMGRKIRSSEDEEAGVATYSRLWGRRIAVITWWCALLATALLAAIVATQLHHFAPIATILLLALAGAAIVGTIFLARPKAGRGRWIENCSGLWTLTLYLSLGALPHVLARAGR
jgi:4-hydroxybenzoate polyprenyltransferase